MSAAANTADRVRTLIVEQLALVDVDGPLKPDTLLREHLEADSLDMVELSLTMEDEFAIQVPVHDLDRLRTVGDVIEYVERRIA